MDETYQAPRQRSLIFTIGLGVLALVGVFVLLIFGSGGLTGVPNLALSLLAVPVMGALIFLIYRTFLLLTTRYRLTRSCLELHWGFQRERIPLDAIEWAHPVSDFDSPMPLPGFVLPWQYYGTRTIRGLGPVVFAATEKAEMVLIRAEDRHFVISPVSARAFAEKIEDFLNLGAEEPVEPLSQNPRTMLTEIFQEKIARRLLIAGLLSLLLLLAVVIAFSATRPSVTWITLEQVSSNRLLLLVLIGGLTWLSNTFLGAYFFLRSLLEKRWVFLLWGWSILICLILTTAAVFMRLGSA